MWALIVLAVLLSGFLYLLFAPFYLEADTRAGLLQFRYHRIASARLVLKDGMPMLALRILFWRRQLDLVQHIRARRSVAEVTIERQHEARAARQQYTQGKGRRKPPSLPLMLALLQTFRLRQLECDIDTGDDLLNARLTPLAYAASQQTGRYIHINFDGETRFVMQIQNSGARLIGTFLRQYFNF